MIHIFDKIYISYAETAVGPNSPARLPQSYVRIIDKGIWVMIEALYQKNEIAYGKSLEEVLSNYDSEEHFFNTLLNEITSGKSPKVIIYLDEHSMLEFLIRWWKAIFPNLTAEGGFALYKNFADNETLQPAKTRESFLDITVKSDRITFDKFALEYWDENKSIFTDKFNSFPAFDLPLSMKSKCSLEFQIIDYLLNPQEMKPDLMAKLIKRYYRQFTIQIFTLVRGLQQKMYYVATEFPDLIQGTLFDGVSIKETLMRDGRFKVLFDFNIQDNGKTYEYLETNYELQKVCKDLLDLEYAMSKAQGFEYDAMEKMDLMVADYAKNGAHPTMEYILQEEMHSLGKYKLFNGLYNKNRFNTILVISVINTLKIKGRDHAILNELKLAE